MREYERNMPAVFSTYNHQRVQEEYNVYIIGIYLLYVEELC